MRSRNLIGVSAEHSPEQGGIGRELCQNTSASAFLDDKAEIVLLSVQKENDPVAAKLGASHDTRSFTSR